jgi:mRNA interferase RelE/StbE
VKEVTYSKSPIKALRRIPANVAKKIVGKIDQYAANPTRQANNVTKLQAREGRPLRVGDYRVIFDEDDTIIAILEIGPRGSIYE